MKTNDVDQKMLKMLFRLGLHACGTQSDFAKGKVVLVNEYVLISFVYRIFSRCWKRRRERLSSLNLLETQENNFPLFSSFADWWEKRFWGFRRTGETERYFYAVRSETKSPNRENHYKAIVTDAETSVHISRPVGQRFLGQGVASLLIGYVIGK